METSAFNVLGKTNCRASFFFDLSCLPSELRIKMFYLKKSFYVNKRNGVIWNLFTSTLRGVLGGRKYLWTKKLELETWSKQHGFWPTTFAILFYIINETLGTISTTAWAVFLMTKNSLLVSISLSHTMQLRQSDIRNIYNKIHKCSGLV